MKFEENPNNAGGGVEVEGNRPENEYDQEASDNEVKNLQEEIEEKVRVKAMELGISEEKLIEVAGLDLESLGVKKLKEGELKEPNLRRGELDFIGSDIGFAINEFNKENIGEAIIKFEKNKKEGEESGDKGRQDENTLEASRLNKFLEFVGKHKKVVSVGELALYLSSYGMPIINALADNDAKVEIDGEKISLKDLADNPEFIKKIDQAKNSGTPIDILREYSPTERYFDYGDDNGFANSFSISAKTEIQNDNEVKKTVSVSFSGLVPAAEEINRLNSELRNIGISLGIPEYIDKEGGGFEAVVINEGSSWNDFIENKEQIAKIIADNFNVSEGAVEKYIDNLIMPDVSKISVVEFDDFKINKNLEIPEDALELSRKWCEICGKHQKINSDAGYWLDASEEEFTEWVQKNGYENIENSADARELLIREKENYENLPAVKFEDFKYQEEMAEYENADKFRDLFLNGLNESGYSIEGLKKTAEENPEEVIEIISEVIGKNVEYDLAEYSDIKLRKLAKELTGKYVSSNYIEKKHSQGIPYITMETGKGVCHDYAITLMTAKHILEEEGVPNLDKFVIISTVSSEMNHQWSNLVTVDQDGKVIVSSLDSTFHDLWTKGKKLNAVDEKHYYTGLPEKVDKAHREALEKIRDYNNYARQKELERILTRYDPKLHKRDQEIEGNKELYKTNKDIKLSRREMEKIAGDLEKSERENKKEEKKK